MKSTTVPHTNQLANTPNQQPIKYQDSFHVIQILGKNQMEVKDQKGHIRQVHVTDVKETTMPEVITNAIPDYSAFGHTIKH